MKKKVIEVERVIKPIKHAQFIVRGGDYNPVGYRGNGLEIKRKRGETDCELRARCLDLVDWPTADTLHVFIPIRSN
jgi:hypothetical protein